MSDLTTSVSKYYEARKLKRPSATEALLWLVSELGELAEAHATPLFCVPEMSFSERFALRAVTWVGKLAERVVAKRGGWTRNNGRKTDFLKFRDERVSDEVGDVLMMLTVYANEEAFDPYLSMLEKFAKKGVVLYGNDAQPPRRDTGDLLPG